MGRGGSRFVGNRCKHKRMDENDDGDALLLSDFVILIAGFVVVVRVVGHAKYKAKHGNEDMTTEKSTTKLK